jgi:CIC family chloride channel protein
VGIKLISTCITLGSGGSGGIFAPSLFLGAMVGGFIGQIFHTIFPEITAGPGAYALVGMGGVVAATTHAPITAIVILFELTGDYKIILPLMLSCIISTLLYMRISRESIYTLKLVRRGVNIFQGHELNILKSMYVRDVMRRDIELIPENTSLSDLMDLTMNSNHSCFYLQDSGKRLIGVIDEIGLRQVLAMSQDLENVFIADDIAKPNVVTVREDDNLDLVMRQFGIENMDELPVVSRTREDKVIGTVFRRDVIVAYNKGILKRDAAGGMASQIKAMRAFSRVEVVEGYSMMEWEVPAHFADRTIRDLAIRRKYGVEVILIKRSAPGAKTVDDIKTVIPEAETKIRTGDVLLLFGENKNLEKIKNL